MPIFHKYIPIYVTRYTLWWVLRLLLIALFFAGLLSGSSLRAINPVILLVGPPGSGKGTFSQHLKEKYGYSHVSIGDVLRREIELQTELGCQIKEIVRRGEYIDPEIISFLLTKNIMEYQGEEIPLILDGFGQNKGDIEDIQKLLWETGLLARTIFVYLDAPDAKCLERIANRSICLGCGNVYNRVTAQPLISDRCNQCGAALKSKINDMPDVTINRLRHYRDCVEKYYQEGLSLFPSVRYDSSGEVEECFSFYDRFAKEAANWQGDSCTFVQEFCTKILYKNFVK